MAGSRQALAVPCGPAASTASACGVGGCGALQGGGCPVPPLTGQVAGTGGRAGSGRAPLACEVPAAAQAGAPRVSLGSCGCGSGACRAPGLLRRKCRASALREASDGGELALLSGPRMPWREPRGFACPTLLAAAPHGDAAGWQQERPGARAVLAAPHGSSWSRQMLA